MRDSTSKPRFTSEPNSCQPDARKSIRDIVVEASESLEQALLTADDLDVLAAYDHLVALLTDTAAADEYQTERGIVVAERDAFARTIISHQE